MHAMRTPGKGPIHGIIVPRRLPAIVFATVLIALAAPRALNQAPGGQMMPNGPQPSPTGGYQPGVNRVPDANDRMGLNQAQAAKSGFEAANKERRRQIADDAAKLLQLATELKAEIDKTDKDTLSLNVIRKAESIEKLAKGVKEKMKLTVGAS